MVSIAELVGPDLDEGVRAVSVGTINGSATIDGTSGPLGNDNDTKLMQSLRDWADVVMVGAGTFMKEQYSSPKPTEARPDPAPLAIPTTKLSFEINYRMWENIDTPPYLLIPHHVLESDEAQEYIQAQKDVGAIILDSGDGTVEACMDTLRAQGWTKILCEGGPKLYGQVIASGQLDQLYHTIDAHIGTAIQTTLAPTEKDPKTFRMNLENVAADDDGTVFLRYGRDKDQ